MRSPQKLPISKSESWRMFDEISPKYDLLNHLLSLGLDIHWRHLLNGFLPNKKNIRLLDLATGTADVVLTLVQKNPNIAQAYGIDLADKMIGIGRKKITQAKLDEKIKLQHGDATKIPFTENNFDVVTMSFGIRNVEDPQTVLNEMHRILNSEGKAIILEFSLPTNSIWRALHLFYLRNFVPLVGGLITGHYQAYKYLNQTIEFFPYGAQFCELMKRSGFIRATAYPLLGGVATIYIGEKK